MSTAVIVLAAAATVMHFQCPEGLRYDQVNVLGPQMAITEGYDIDHCTLHGDTAHCRVVGKSLMNGDVYDVFAHVTPRQVILNGPNGVVCKRAP